ncbi:MAG TPA: cytochrome c oxidase assembly protein [Acidimicrobiales bacterium]|nr:cytochrome c oxidase assembly protein [Acidimicrobiales bacterium]
MPMNHIPWSVHNALTRWQDGPFALFTVAVLIGVAYWYLRADWQLASRGRRWPRRRVACFLAGLVAVDLAIQSPVATFTATYFEAHVIQHLLLMVVAAPLLALGAPSTLLLQTSSRRTKTLWLRVLRSRPFALLTFPVVVWGLYFGVMFGFFLSSLIQTAMLHMWLMDIMNVVFLFGATLYWWPMVGLDPIVHWRMGYGARMVNILLGGPPEVILGLAILSSHQSIASMYSLSSTHAGGGLLWVSTEAATLFGFIPIFWQWIRADERAARRSDAGLDAATDASPGLVPDLDLGLPAAVATAGAGDGAWESYWRMRTGRVPGRAAWTPNRPGPPGG